MNYRVVNYRNIILLIYITIIFIMVYNSYSKPFFGILLILLPGFLIENYFFSNSENPIRLLNIIGFSISYLIFMSIIINYLYPIIGYNEPLSTISILFTYTVILLILGVIYHKKKVSIELPSLSFNFDLQDKLSIVIALSLIVITILGTVLVNIISFNLTLLLIAILIPLYCAVMTIHRFNPNVYIIAIFSISLALSIISPLRGNYPTAGGDMPTEIDAIYTTLKNLAWSVTINDSPIMATLSTGILIPVIHQLSGIRPETIYRFLGPLLMSLIPPGLFLANKRYFEIRESFLISTFITSQYNFISNIGSRVQISWFFMGLMVIIFLELDFLYKELIRKKLLILIFLFSLVVSYYTYSYLFTFLLFITFILLFIFSKRFGSNEWKLFFILTMISLVAIFLWWSQITNIHFEITYKFLQNFISSFVDIAKVDSRDNLGQKAIGFELNPPERINAIIFYISLVLVLIGILNIFYKTLYKRLPTFSFLYITMMSANIVIWILAVTVPTVSQNFGIDRAYFFGLPILAPTLVVGANKISEKINLSKNRQFPQNWGNFIIILLIFGHLMISLGLTWQFFGDHHSVLINNDGLQYDIWYTHNQEVKGENWLLDHATSDYKINGDAYLDVRLIFSDKGNMPISIGDFFKNNIPTKDYIFLRYQNVKTKTVIPWYIRKVKDDYIPLQNYSKLFIDKRLIYDNGGSEVYK